MYLRNAAPTAIVVAETTIPNASESEFNQTVTLVYEARTRDGTMFWQDRERPAHDETHTERVRSEATLDIGEIADRHQAITADLGDGGSVDIYLEIKTNYQTDIYTGTEVERSNLSLHTNSYTIEPVTATNTCGTPSTEIRTDTTSGITLGEMVFLPYTTLVLGIIGAGAAGSAVVGYRLRRDIDPAVETAAIHHDRYKERVSRGKLPPIDSRSVIIMETLADLVDTVIDMDGRVIYDPTQNCYAVVSEQAVFVFVKE